MEEKAVSVEGGSKCDRRLLAVASLQQTLAMFAGLTMVPLIIARAVGIDDLSSRQMVNIAILAGGMTTFLQCGRFGCIGSGYLLMMGTSSLFIAPSIMAGKEGGAALIFGMTLLMSSVELVLAPLACYLKKLAPPVVTAVLVVLLAFAVLPVSMQQFGGGFGADFGHWKHIVLGLVTMVGILAAQFSPWRVLRTGSIVFGLLLGYAVGHFMGLANYANVAGAEWLGCPRPFWYGIPKFSWNHVLPFGIAYMLTTLETYGDIHAIALVTDGNMNKVNDGNVTGGLLADGLGSLLAGAFGTSANTSFSGNIAIAQMSGATSPVVGYLVAVMLLLLSCLPKVSAVIVSMPAAVLGGSMLMACAFLLKVGFQMLLNTARGGNDLLVAAIGITAGLGVQMTPKITCQALPWLASLLSSSVCAGAVVTMLAAAFLVRGKGR